MLLRNKFLLCLVVPALTFGLAACGSSSNSGGSSGAKSVDVYSSLPLQGASKDQIADMVNGIHLALSQAGGKAGDVSIKYQSLDDSTASAGGWDQQKTLANARQVVADSKAIALIGEFNSGATKVSLPTLNRAGVAQISPANTYVGLTTNDPGSIKGEPQMYQPSGQKTYVRIVPRDTIQGAALVATMKSAGCTDVAMANDKDTYGEGLAKVVGIDAKPAGLKVSSNTGIDPHAANYRGFAAKIKGEGADCFFFGGVTGNGAAQLYKDVAAAIPGVKTYGGDGVCESGLTNPKKGGIPTSVAKNFHCTVATLNLQSYPGGRDFMAAFKKAYGNAHPDPYAIYGYEAMSLVIDTLKTAGADGTTRAGFLKTLLATKDRKSVLGTYSFDPNGDTTLTDYGLYKVGADGDPQYESVIKAG